MEGVVEGRIAEAPRGAGGFGYDPVFFYPPLGGTFGEIDAEAKHRVSHRGVAAARGPGTARRLNQSGAESSPGGSTSRPARPH